MKTPIILCAALLAGSLFADTPPASQAQLNLSKLSPAERKAFREKIITEKHGGYVTAKGTPSGKVVIVNAQDKVTPDNFDITKQKTLSRMADIIKLVKGAPATPATAAKLKAEAGADFAVFIVDDKALPASLIAPEEKWGIMNVAALEKNAATPEVVRIRARNEFARVFAMTCGGFSSQFQAPLTNFVKDIADLDACLVELPVDVQARVTSYLAYCNVKPERKVPYRRACQEGWAPAPTNAVQKTVWDSVHAMPDKPITIKKNK